MRLKSIFLIPIISGILFSPEFIFGAGIRSEIWEGSFLVNSPLQCQSSGTWRGEFQLSEDNVLGGIFENSAGYKGSISGELSDESLSFGVFDGNSNVILSSVGKVTANEVAGDFIGYQECFPGSGQVIGSFTGKEILAKSQEEPKPMLEPKKEQPISVPVQPIEQPLDIPVAEPVATSTIFSEIEKVIQEFISDPRAIKIAEEVGLPVSIAVSAVSAGAVTFTASAGSASVAFNLSQLFQSLSLSRFYLLGLIRFRRRNPWGKVTDKMSGKSLPLTLVQIYDQEFHKLKDSQITDKEGRFGALAGVGRYYVKASRKGYRDIQSETVVLTLPEQILNLELGMMPAGELSLQVINSINILNQLKKFIELINPSLLILGTIISLLTLVVVPTTLNYAVFATYIVLDVIKIYLVFKLVKPFGAVVDHETKKPLSLAIVRIFDIDKNWLLTTKVTDENGHFNFLVAPGRYYFTIDKVGYVPFHSDPISLSKSGVVDFDVKMKKAI